MRAQEAGRHIGQTKTDQEQLIASHARDSIRGDRDFRAFSF